MRDLISKNSKFVFTIKFEKNQSEPYVVQFHYLNMSLTLSS